MAEQDDTRQTRNVEYHQIKANSFRVIHVDGGIGGLTPRGYFHIAVYNERRPIPRVRTRAADGEGGFGEEVTTELLGEPNIGVTREVEASLIFDKQTAQELKDWLERQLDEIARLEATSGAGTK